MRAELCLKKLIDQRNPFKIKLFFANSGVHPHGGTVPPQFEWVPAVELLSLEPGFELLHGLNVKATWAQQFAQAAAVLLEASIKEHPISHSSNLSYDILRHVQSRVPERRPLLRLPGTSHEATAVKYAEKTKAGKKTESSNRYTKDCKLYHSAMGIPPYSADRDLFLCKSRMGLQESYMIHDCQITWNNAYASLKLHAFLTLGTLCIQNEDQHPGQSVSNDGECEGVHVDHPSQPKEIPFAVFIAHHHVQLQDMLVPVSLHLLKVKLACSENLFGTTTDSQPDRCKTFTDTNFYSKVLLKCKCVVQLT